MGGENFFYLDPNTGVLTTKRLLTNTPETFYQVRKNISYFNSLLYHKTFVKSKNHIPQSKILAKLYMLTEFFKKYFQLTVQASDGRGRAANATASITITRIPSDQRPVFISTPNATITFKRLVNSSVLTVAARDPNLVVNFLTVFILYAFNVF